MFIIHRRYVLDTLEQVKTSLLDASCTAIKDLCTLPIAVNYPRLNAKAF